jgi:hypothetical protein
MTLGSLMGVAVLAAQAARAAPQVSNAAPKPASRTATAQPTVSATSSAAPDKTVLPDASGSGARVVYAEAAQRVWLVGSDNSVVRTFQVVPGTVAAPTGRYRVNKKLPGEPGTDGTPIQYVVLFGQRYVGGKLTTFGFDAVMNVTGLPSPPTARTGGIRMAQLDAQALWSFAPLGALVVIVA